MKKYYECHITFNGEPGYSLTCVESLGWKFSRIDSDLDLGAGSRCYATKQFNFKYSEQIIIDVLEDMANDLKTVGLNPIRSKVEVVIYDKRI